VIPPGSFFVGEAKLFYLYRLAPQVWALGSRCLTPRSNLAAVIQLSHRCYRTLKSLLAISIWSVEYVYKVLRYYNKLRVVGSRLKSSPDVL
jgi:hypothetical protein